MSKLLPDKNAWQNLSINTHQNTSFFSSFFLHSIRSLVHLWVFTHSSHLFHLTALQESQVLVELIRLGYKPVMRIIKS